MTKDDFKAQVIGFNYSNIDGTGWPHAVSLDNGESVFGDEYAQRDYYPVDFNELAALASDIKAKAIMCEKKWPTVSLLLEQYAVFLNKAIGVENAGA